MTTEASQPTVAEAIVSGTALDVAAAVAAGTWNPRPLPDDQYDRRRYIGGSNAAAIMGVGATYDGVQQTAVGVYHAKIAETPEEMSPDKQKFLERRKRWEPVVIQMLKEELDVEVVATNVRYVDPELDFLAAEIDFEWRDEDGSIQNGEIKSVAPFAFGGRFGWGEAGSGDVPVHYEAQCVHGLSVMGRKKCILAAMVGLDAMIFYKIERDEAMIHEMRKRETLFWRNCVLKRVPPDPQTLGDLRVLFPVANGLSVESSTDVGSKALQLRALRGQINALEMQQDSLEFDVKLAMGSAEILTVNGRKIFSWKDQESKRFEVTALKESEDKEEKKIYRKYLKTSKTRVFKGLSWND